MAEPAGQYLLLGVKRTATFSPCRRYRYTLRIIWDETKPVAAFIGLNPSTATEFADDNTVRRCKNFAAREGCGGMVILNLFAYRATLPEDMKAEREPIGDENRLAEFLEGCDGPHIACWGTHGSHLGRGDFIAPLFPELLCFGRNADGSPKHPLYLKKTTPLIPLHERR